MDRDRTHPLPVRRTGVWMVVNAVHEDIAYCRCPRCDFADNHISFRWLWVRYQAHQIRCRLRRRRQVRELVALRDSLGPRVLP